MLLNEKSNTLSSNQEMLATHRLDYRDSTFSLHWVLS